MTVTDHMFKSSKYLLHQAGHPYMARPPIGATWMIKQILDAGAQTLLIPMVESAEQASELVRAVT